MAAAALLATVCLSAVGRSRQPADQIVCANNLSILGQALLMYSAENKDLLPPRSTSNRWPSRLYEYYGDTNILRCPADARYPMTFGSSAPNPGDLAPRSYLINGFQDYFGGNAAIGATMPAQAIKLPSQTIVFGEKETASGHFWLDYWPGDDYASLEQSRHHAGNHARTGGANYGFADGSVRFLGYGQAFWPTNLWAVRDEVRSVGVGP